MSSSYIPQHRGQYSFEEMDSESLVYRRSAKQGIYLNETGTIVWKLCDGTRNVEQIVDILVAAYPDVANAVRSDVIETINELVRTGALKMLDPQNMSDVSVSDKVVATTLH